MSLKVLFVLSLVAAASANPTPTFGLIPVFGDIVHIGASGIGHTIGTLFKTVSGVEHVAENIITDLFNIKVRAFTDVINLGVKVTLGLADVVDASISGLGNLIARIVGATIKIVMCFLGGAGDATVCSDNWNIQFGVSATTAVDARALIRLYGLSDCYSRVHSIIRVITRGGGIAVVNGSIRVILQVALDLASLVNRVINGTYRLAKADLTLIFRKIAIILGAIGNSHQNGSGLKILNNFIPTCNKYFISAGYPSFGNWKDVEVIIDLGNGDNAPWALTAIDGSASTAVSVDTAIGGLIGNVLKGVIGVTRLASNVIQDIVGLVINTFDDVITLAVKIVLGLGGLLDSTIAGLGSLLVRIVAALIQIVLCFLGDSGKYGVCRPGWGRQFGVNSDASSIETVISLYGLTNCKAAVNKYIYTYTKGKGISSVSGSTLILLQSTVTLSEYVDAGKFDRSILVKVFQQLAYLLGAVGNSNARGVGTRVCNKFIPTCNKFLAAEGYSGLGNNLQAIIKVIERANDDEYLWSADVGGYIKGSGFVVGTGVSRSTGVVGTIGGIIGGLLGGVFQVVEGVTKLASNILTDIFSIKIKAITDVFNLIVKLALGLGGVIDSTVAGLGSLLARVVAVILKIGICVNGLPGDRSICENGWNAQFGVYGESNTQSGLIELFNVGKAQYELDIYINKLTNNKGIESTSGSLRIILERCRIAASYVSVSKQITKQSITDVFVIYLNLEDEDKMTTISAAISNSNKENSGKQIVNQVITTCGPYLRDHGYPDVTVQVTVVIRVIASANNDSINWTGGNTGNTGDNTGNTGDNTGNTGDNTGNTEDNTGNTGDNSGYTGDNTGNTGDHSGNTGDSTGDTGDHSGNTEDSTGDTGDHSGNTGDHSGNTGDHSGNTGDHSGNTGDHSGNTGDSTGDTGDHSGNTGDHSENTGDHSGNTSDHSGNTGDHSGNTGDSTGDTSDHSGNTGDHSGNTGDHSENTCDHSENTGDHSGNTGDHSGNTGDSTVNTGDHSGNTGDSTGYTGDHSGNTGDSTGDTGDHSGNTGDHSGNTGDNTGNTGDSSGSDTGKNNGNMGGNTSGGSVTIGGGVSFDFGGFIGGIFKGLTGVTKLVSNIIKQIISIKINAFVDVLNLAFKVSLGIGGVINSVIVGLGSILARIIAVIFKIGICVNGFPGDRNICTKTWNAQFGIDGDATTADDLIAIFGLQNCRADVDKIISVYTNGKGISSIENGSIRIVFENVVTLATVVSGGVSKQDVSASWSRLFIIVGAVLNASNKGSGTELTQKIVPACNQYFVRQGYPALISAEQIIAIISEANNHRWQAVSHQTVIAQGDVLVEKVKNLFQTVKDKNNLQNTSVTAVLNLDVPNSFDGVLVFAVKIVRALGAILDKFIKGLGSFLVRMVAFLLRYTACVLGAARNSKCYICQNAFYESLGVAVKGNTYADIAAAFNVENAKAELDAILAAYTDKGRASLAGSVKIAFDQAYALVALVSKPRIEEADLSLTLNSCAKLFGGFANSCSPGLGKQICSGMLPVCSTFLQQNQYPALDSASISAAIAAGNGDAAPWARSAVTTAN